IYYADRAARLEHDFVLQPHADASRIAFRFEGADHVRIDAAGDLVVKIGGGEIRQLHPVIYQDTDGGRKSIAGGYRLGGDNTVGFWLGAYDHTLPLRIDPVTSFLTYLGGAQMEFGWGIALGSDNSIYVAGETLSKKFFPATAGAFQTNYN